MHFHELGDGMGDQALLQRLHVLMRLVSRDPARLVPLSRLEESFRRRVRAGHGEGDDAFHVIVVLDVGRLVGGAVSSYLAGPNAGFVEVLAVDGRRRAPGLARRLLDRTERALAADARRTGRDLDWICADDVPRAPDGSDAAARPGIWERWGHHLLDVPESAGGARLAVRGLSPRYAGGVPDRDVLARLSARGPGSAAGTPPEGVTGRAPGGR